MQKYYWGGDTFDLSGLEPTARSSEYWLRPTGGYRGSLESRDVGDQQVAICPNLYMYGALGLG